MWEEEREVQTEERDTKNNGTNVSSIVSLPEALERVEAAILSFLAALIGEEPKATLLGRDLFKAPRLFMRTLRVLQLIHALLSEDRIASQRDLYYQLAGFFTGGAGECNAEISFIACSLGLSRISLNIYAASRGFIVGHLQMLDDSGHWIDLASLGRDGRTISGDMSDLRRPIRSDHARFILVVEKEGIYQELSDAKFFHQQPCIMVTAHGVPDVATRALVSRLSNDLEIPVYALVDWNPGGVQVAFTYRFGSYSAQARNVPEKALYEISSFFWLGMHSDDARQVADEHKVPMSAGDLIRLNSLRTAPKTRHMPAVQAQLDRMEELNVRVELQALRHDGGVLVDYVTEKILKRHMIQI